MNQFERPQVSPAMIRLIVVAVVVVVIVIPLGMRFFKSVPPGHVAVATFFGKIQPTAYPEGLNFPVNPFYSWYEFDGRQKTHKENAGVPSQDQLTTMVDVSVQYRIKGDMAPSILGETGTAIEAIEVHLVPKMRSLLREQGKSIERAEDFFLEETQQRIQIALEADLQASLAGKGIEIQDVLIREITLPPRLISQIEQKKEAEQQAERQKAELARYTTEREQQVVDAEAQRRAAEEQAKRQMVLADAQAYEIEKINTAIASNPAYIRLQALQALMAISKDPASKIYFMNGESTMPLPLLHMGDELTK